MVLFKFKSHQRLCTSFESCMQLKQIGAWINAHRILEKKGACTQCHTCFIVWLFFGRHGPQLCIQNGMKLLHAKGALPHRNVGSGTHALKCEKISELLPAFELLLCFHTHVASSCVCSLHPYNTGIATLDLMLDPVWKRTNQIPFYFEMCLLV